MIKRFHCPPKPTSSSPILKVNTEVSVLRDLKQEELFDDTSIPGIASLKTAETSRKRHDQRPSKAGKYYPYRGHRPAKSLQVYSSTIDSCLMALQLSHTDGLPA